jgi:hypothetical protein
MILWEGLREVNYCGKIFDLILELVELAEINGEWIIVSGFGRFFKWFCPRGWMICAEI